MPVVARHPQKTLQLLPIAWSWEVGHRSHLPRVHFNLAVICNDVAKIGGFRLTKIAFRSTQFQVCFAQPDEHLLQMLQMFFKRIREHEQIVHINQAKLPVISPYNTVH